MPGRKSPRSPCPGLAQRRMPQSPINSCNLNYFRRCAGLARESLLALWIFIKRPDSMTHSRENMPQLWASNAEIAYKTGTDVMLVACRFAWMTLMFAMILWSYLLSFPSAAFCKEPLPPYWYCHKIFLEESIFKKLVMPAEYGGGGSDRTPAITRYISPLGNGKACGLAP